MNKEILNSDAIDPKERQRDANLSEDENQLRSVHNPSKTELNESEVEDDFDLGEADEKEESTED